MFRRVDGGQLAVFAVLVAVVPALVLWGAAC